MATLSVILLQSLKGICLGVSSLFMVAAKDYYHNFCGLDNGLRVNNWQQ
jgi:hypothetical protein